ncbi:hypothetical protein ACFR99_00165 [Haloarchaeobius amylolyticus]|uniref:DUF7344 domain-containing protein n=1 Tax=Haloarchaeobius amylolyticus TaxID=1198296 RepID=A0ABD6BCW4_9EURY
MSRSQSNTLEMETIHELLANTTRRDALAVLRAVERTTPEELGRRLASSKRDCEADDPDTRRAITIALVHKHLPRLDTHDVVDYRHHDAVVTLGENFDDLEPFFEPLEHRA